ncbi:MAG: PrsW family glutamic-type intramembrane protease [bacterium]|nr:PrsW family glutamic-type intramembrane protease [bacterium]
MAPIILLFGILPGAIWLLFYLQEDIDHEPVKEILYAFFAGAAITIIVLGLQNIFSDISAPFISINTFSPIYLFILAGIEEFFKFGAAYLLISRSKYFNVPVDAMVYMIVVALGFATVENIGALQNQFRETAMLSAILGTATLRFIGATLLHTLASALVGYYWAKGLIAKRLISRLAIGLFIATSLHATFNFLVLQNQEQITYPILLLVIVAFFVMSDFEKLRRVSSDKDSAELFEQAREEAV